MDQTATDSASAPARADQQGRSQPDWAGHPVDVRLTIPLPFRSYYLTIVAGPEKRCKQRRAVERKKHPLFTMGNVIVCIVAGIICGLAALSLIELLVAHAMKSGSLLAALLAGLLLMVDIMFCAWLLKRRPFTRFFRAQTPSDAVESNG